MTRIVAVANQKGGVGKTTSVLTLASAAAALGQRVLIIDLDPQGNTTSTILPEIKDLLAAKSIFTAYHLLDEEVEEGDINVVIVPTKWAGIDLIASGPNLSRRESEGTHGVELRLQSAMKYLTPNKYDLILIDTPPSLGRLTLNSFLAANEILLVTEASEYCVDALAATHVTIGYTQKNFSHPLTVAGLVVTKMEQTNAKKSALATFEASYGDYPIWQIPKHTVTEDCAKAKTAIFATNTNEARKVAAAYTAVALGMGFTAKPIPVQPIPVPVV